MNIINIFLAPPPPRLILTISKIHCSRPNYEEIPILDECNSKCAANSNKSILGPLLKVTKPTC